MPDAATTDATPWWKRGVIYQVYPRSFQDTNGDGIGDLRGLARRADYLARLGVDAVWVSPVYPSPMRDFGYDVSDFTGIDAMFGTLDDFDALVAALHARGLKLLMDFVPGHSSNAHPWFVEAASSREAAKRDWYVWRDPGPDGGPPNNWVSEFGGPAWTLHEPTGQYYYHAFLPEQPTLNWRNPDLRAAMHDALRFWFERGVDGFRVDAFENLVPDASLRDNPPNPNWSEKEGPARAWIGQHTKHQPETHDIAAEMRSVAAEYGTDPECEKLMIGEIYGTFAEVVAYYGARGEGFQLPFNFALITARWTAPALAGLIETYEGALPAGAWPNWVLGNHDRPRVASRVGMSRARLATMLLLTSRGTPTIYQGDELGMENVPIPPEAVVDPWERNVPGQGLGRDPVRTPMPWTNGPGAGFTNGDPWLPIGVPCEGPVDEQEADPRSMLAFTRALLALRRAEPALSLGDYRTVSVHDGVFVFERTHGARTLRVALNLSAGVREVPDVGTVLLATQAEPGATLPPDQGIVYAPEQVANNNGRLDRSGPTRPAGRRRNVTG